MKYICLNLNKRKDRWKQAQQEFKKQGLTVERFAAIEDENPLLSFNLSQQAILQSITENTVVFEDDVLFLNNNLNQYIDNAPQGWDMLYFGGNVTENLSKITDHWWRCKGTWTTHAVAYTPKAASYILQHYKPFSSLMYDDFIKKEIQPVLNVYICKPFVCTQRASFSDLWQTDADYQLEGTENNLL